MQGQIEGKNPRKGGLYSRVRMPVETANVLVLLGAVLLLLVIFLSSFSGGFTVMYDANGGTSVERDIAYYGETLAMPEAPQRMGYTFTGWYTDEACTVRWETDTPVSGSMTLYAGWKR